MSWVNTVVIPVEPTEEQYDALKDTALTDPFQLTIQVEDEEGDPFTGQITEGDHEYEEFFWVTNHLGEYDETPQDRYGAYFEMDFDQEGYASILLGNGDDMDVNYWGLDVNEVTESIEFELDQLGKPLEGKTINQIVVEVESIIVTEEDGIQDAIDNASEGDTILVESGTYEEGVTIETEDLTLLGEEGATISNALTDNGSIKAGSESMVTVTADGVTFEGMEIETTPSDGAPPNAIILDGDESEAIGNTVTHGSEVSGHPLIGGEGDGVVIEENIVENGPVAYWGDGEAKLTDNNFRGEALDEALWSTSSGNLTVQGNDFTDVETGEATVKFTEEDVTVNGETTGKDIAESVFEENDGVESVEWNGQTYDAKGNLLVQEGDSIQAAVDAADEGDTIIVEEGTYEESLKIETENISLQGTDGRPFLSGEGIKDYGTYLDADDVMFKNFEVKDFGDRGIYAYSDETVIDNVYIHNNENDGIRVRDSEGVLIQNSESSENEGDGISFYAYGEINNTDVHDNHERGIYHAGNTVEGQGHVTVEESDISGNNFSGERAGGVILYGGPSGGNTLSVTVEDNNVENNEGTGISVYKINHEQDSDEPIDDQHESSVSNNEVSGTVANDHDDCH